LDDRIGAAHSDENPGYLRVFASGVPALDDLADSPEFDGRTQGEGLRDATHARRRLFRSARITFGRSETQTDHKRSFIGPMPNHATCSTLRRPK
jgi:hypothetical protein